MSRSGHVYPGRVRVKGRAPLVDLVSGESFAGPPAAWEAEAWHKKRYGQFDYWWLLTPGGRLAAVHKRHAAMLEVRPPLADSGAAAEPFLHLFPKPLW